MEKSQRTSQTRRTAWTRGPRLRAWCRRWKRRTVNHVHVAWREQFVFDADKPDLYYPKDPTCSGCIDLATACLARTFTKGDGIDDPCPPTWPIRRPRLAGPITLVTLVTVAVLVLAALCLAVPFR